MSIGQHPQIVKRDRFGNKFFRDQPTTRLETARERVFQAETQGYLEMVRALIYFNVFNMAIIIDNPYSRDPSWAKECEAFGYGCASAQQDWDLGMIKESN